MLKIENVEVSGWQSAIRGMRNPMNSWHKSDSEFDKNAKLFSIGDNDLELMNRLANAGHDHRKFLRMIVVYADITAPIYWWKEADTYKVGTVTNSCSTMHKIHAQKFSLEDFSAEHLTDDAKLCLINTIGMLNSYRDKFNETKAKMFWWQLIQLLPSSYNQRRTMMINYEVLANMYQGRRNHKLDEWHTFCDWIDSLPCSELVTSIPTIEQ